MILIRENVERHTEDPREAKRLISMGYTIINGEIPPETADKAESEMTVKELRELAKKHGISGASSLNKAELIEVLKEADNGSVDDGTTDEDSTETE